MAALALDPDPCPQTVLLRPPRPPQLAVSVRRATIIFALTVASYIVSLVTVAVSCAMAVRSLTVAVAKFVMASTVSFWRYPSSGFAVVLCAAP